MIPITIRNLWRPYDEEEDDHGARQAAVADTHDSVQRYVQVGIFIILLIGALYMAKAIVLPVVAGVIIGLVLGPLVDKMVRLGLPQGLSAGLLVGAGVIVTSFIIGIFAAPFAIWSDQLPGMMAALQDKLSTVARMAKQIDSLTSDISPTTVPQVAVTGGSSLFNIAMTSVSAAGGLLIFVFTAYFYLATRRHWKARALRMCLGASARRTTGAFLGDLESKIASYFGIVTLINFGMGAITTAVAWAAGLPFPVFWGLVAFVLNYIAFVGPVIMTALLVGAMLLAGEESWWALVPAFAYFVAHTIEGNIINPMMVGRRLTLSPLLVFLSFVFWLWLWGPLGAILSTPLLLVISLAIEAYQRYRTLEAEAAAAEHDGKAESQEAPIGALSMPGPGLIAPDRTARQGAV